MAQTTTRMETGTPNIHAATYLRIVILRAAVRLHPFVVIRYPLKGPYDVEKANAVPIDGRSMHGREVPLLHLVPCCV